MPLFRRVLRDAHTPAFDVLPTLRWRSTLESVSTVAMTRRPTWRVHPQVREDGRYAVWILKRVRIAGRLYRVGQDLLIPGERLRVAAWLCASGAARPADERTALDVALFIELHRAGPAAKT